MVEDSNLDVEMEAVAMMLTRMTPLHMRPHVPAVAPKYRWTSPAVNGQVPTYLPNLGHADNHWIDSVGATEDE
eukprot:scaffold199645_cov24-Attheya_sp.AAC.1